ncbi:uncharacterized protein LOC135160295 isoform X2 [Diachasmimorpha longicaudata]|uniref:uncharacterized protein LOC135160295 isoform X2 n=1 Tax=Diachasmimorpha longicaudata TaxID=58733 RepID=UPI0030B8DDFF
MKLDYAWTVVFFILQFKFSHAELLLTQILVHHAECTPSRLSLGGNKTRKLGASLREEYKNLMDAEKIYFRPEKTSISIQSAMQLAQGLLPDYSPTDQEIANMTFKSNSWFDVVQLEVDPLFVGWLKCQHILPEVDLHGPELVGDWGNDTESFQQYFGQWTGSNFVENVRSGLVYRRIRAMAEVDLRVADCFDRADPDEELKSFTIDEYRIQSATDDLIQYNGGTHLAIFLRHVDNYLNGLEMRRLFILVGDVPQWHISTGTTSTNVDAIL